MTLQETWQAAIVAAQKMNGDQEVNFAASGSSPLQPKLVLWEAAVDALENAKGTIGEASARRKALSALNAVKDTTAAYEKFVKQARDGDGVSWPARQALLTSLPELNNQIDASALNSGVKTLRELWQESKEAAKKENGDEAPSFDAADGSALGPKLDQLEQAARALDGATNGSGEKAARVKAQSAYNAVKSTLGAYTAYLKDQKLVDVSDRARTVLIEQMVLTTIRIEGIAKELNLTTTASVGLSKVWTPWADIKQSNDNKVVNHKALLDHLEAAGFRIEEASQLGESNRFLIATKDEDFTQAGRPVLVFPIGTAGQPLAPISALPVARQLSANGFEPEEIEAMTGMSVKDQSFMTLSEQSEPKQLFRVGNDIKISQQEDATKFDLVPTDLASFNKSMSDHNIPTESSAYQKVKLAVEPGVDPVWERTDTENQTKETNQ